MNYVKFISGANKVQMSAAAVEAGLTLFQMDYKCDVCSSDIFSAGSLQCAECRGANPMSPSNEVKCREMYLTGKYSLSTLSTKLNIPLKDIRWHLLKAGLVGVRNNKKPKVKFSNERVIMSLTRDELIKKGHDDIRASSILELFKRHTPQNMRAVVRINSGRILSVNRQAI